MSTGPMLDPHALVGLAGEIVSELAKDSEADEPAILISILAGFGNAIGRTAYAYAGGNQYTNLYACIVGDTSTARKGTSWNISESLLRLAFRDWGDRILTSLTTGEGLIHEIRDERKSKTRDPGSGELVEKVVDAGVDDKRLFAVTEEFSLILARMKREGNILSGTLRDAWQSKLLTVPTKGNPMRATEPHVGCLAHITSEELIGCLTMMEVWNGFGNRYIFILACRHKFIPLPVEPDPTMMERLAAELRSCREFSQSVKRMDFTPEARRVWCGIYETHLERAEPGTYGAMRCRASAQIRRLAVIYALLGRSPVVRLEDLLAALAVWDYADATLRHIWGKSSWEGLAKKIYGFLLDSQEGLSRTSISDALGRHEDADKISSALAILAAHGLAEMYLVETKGRSTEMWRVLERVDDDSLNSLLSQRKSGSSALERALEIAGEIEAASKSEVAGGAAAKGACSVVVGSREYGELLIAEKWRVLASVRDSGSPEQRKLAEYYREWGSVSASNRGRGDAFLSAKFSEMVELQRLVEAQFKEGFGTR